MPTKEDVDRARSEVGKLAAVWRACPWYQSGVAGWPGPIAHELSAMAEALEGGDAGSALLQLRDTGEVLIKFAAIAVGRDLIENGSPAIAADTRLRFFKTPLLTGTWVSLLRDYITQFATLPAAESRVSYPIVRAYQSSERLRQQINAFPNIRNTTIGHTVNPLQPAERVRHLGAVLFGPNGSGDGVCLAALVAEAHSARMFEGLELTLIEANGKRHRLIGAGSMSAWHNYAAPGEHELQTAKVTLSRGSAELRLNPFIRAEKCKTCEHTDVFFFDNLHQHKPPGQFNLHDFPNGHSMRPSGKEVADLGDELACHGPQGSGGRMG
jgi:hypothetical protein